MSALLSAKETTREELGWSAELLDVRAFPDACFTEAGRNAFRYGWWSWPRLWCVPGHTACGIGPIEDELDACEQSVGFGKRCSSKPDSLGAATLGQVTRAP